VFFVTERIESNDLGEQVAKELLAKHGPLITGEDLWRTVGFNSSTAFRQAKSQGRLDLPVFSVPNRKGTFAFTRHVAQWLQKLAKEVEM